MSRDVMFARVADTLILFLRCHAPKMHITMPTSLLIILMMVRRAAIEIYGYIIIINIIDFHVFHLRLRFSGAAATG